MKDIPLYIADVAEPGSENEVPLFCVSLFLGLNRRYSKRFRWFAILSAVVFFVFGNLVRVYFYFDPF